jgi:hypothetical protein
MGKFKLLFHPEPFPLSCLAVWLEFYFKKRFGGWVWWCISTMPVTQESEIGMLTF